MTIEELEAQLAAAKKAKRLAGQAAQQAMQDRIRGMIEWSVRWIDKYTMHVAKRYTAEALAVVEHMKAEYPEHCYLSQEQQSWMGMTYTLIGNVLVQSSGGWVVLNIKRSGFLAWMELTDEQVACFHAGIVPEELKIV